MINEQALKSEIKRDLKLICFNDIDSTSSYARRVFNGQSQSFLVAAERQTAGRGRQGRTFLSEPGGAYFSLALKKEDFPKNLGLITPAAAVAVRGALEQLYGAPCKIKWVNDIYVHGKKVCGILSEALTETDGTIRGILIGFGINLENGNFPRSLPNAGTMALFSVKRPEKEGVIAAVINAVFSAFSLSDSELIGKYKLYNLVLGRRIEFDLSGRRLCGTAKDIDDDGGLLVDCDGKIERLSSNDISIRFLDALD